MDHTPEEAHPQPSGFAVLFHDRGLLIFRAAMFTFHLANAAMLPLVGQVLALQNTDVGTASMAMCIVAAQVVMVPTAYLAGAKADSWGRKPIFLVAFAVLTARGFLYTFPTTRTGWSACRSSTASEPEFSARCSRSSCRTSRTGPDDSTSAWAQ
jgi:MFS family permease